MRIGRLLGLGILPLLVVGRSPYEEAVTECAPFLLVLAAVIPHLEQLPESRYVGVAA